VKLALGKVRLPFELVHALYWEWIGLMERHILETGHVIWCEAESAQQMNVSRAERWGLPLDRIIAPLNDPREDFSLSNPEHREALEARILQTDARFIVMDSLRGATTGDENSSESSKELKYLADLAKRCQIPILVVHHLRKKSKFDSSQRIEIDRIRGSSGIAQFPRCIMALNTPNTDFPDKRKLQVIKNNLGRYPEPIGITITDHGIDSITDIEKWSKAEPITQREKAKDFLRDFLKDGLKPSNDIYAEGEKRGLDEQTLRRAKNDLRVVARREGKIWVWESPPDEQPSLISP